MYCDGNDLVIVGLLSLLIYGYLQKLGGSSIGAQGEKYFRLGAFAGSYYDFDAAW